MAVIEFQGYRINKMSYTRNEDYDKYEDTELENEINFSINKLNHDKEASLIISLKAGDPENENSPFFIDVEIEGYYQFRIEEDEGNIGFEQYLLTNGSAILYPYLRGIISMLTNQANEFPAYILPTINIGKFISEASKSNNDLT